MTTETTIEMTIGMTIGEAVEAEGMVQWMTTSSYLVKSFVWMTGVRGFSTR